MTYERLREINDVSATQRYIINSDIEQIEENKIYFTFYFFKQRKLPICNMFC